MEPPTHESPGEVLLSCQGIGRKGNFHLGCAAMQRSLASAIVPRSTPLLSGQPLQRLALHMPQHHAHCSSSCNSLLSAEPTRRRNSSQGAFMDVGVDVELGIAKDRTQALQNCPSTPLKRGGHCILKNKSFASPRVRFTESSVSNNAMYGSS